MARTKQPRKTVKRKFSELNFTVEAKSSKMASPEPSAKRIEFEFKRKLMLSSKGLATDKHQDKEFPMSSDFMAMDCSPLSELKTTLSIQVC